MKYLLFIFLTIFLSCNNQENTKSCLPFYPDLLCSEAELKEKGYKLLNIKSGYIGVLYKKINDSISNSYQLDENNIPIVFFTKIKTKYLDRKLLNEILNKNNIEIVCNIDSADNYATFVTYSYDLAIYYRTDISHISEYYEISSSYNLPSQIIMRKERIMNKK